MFWTKGNWKNLSFLRAERGHAWSFVAPLSGLEQITALVVVGCAVSIQRPNRPTRVTRYWRYLRTWAVLPHATGCCSERFQVVMRLAANTSSQDWLMPNRWTPTFGPVDAYPCALRAFKFNLHQNSDNAFVRQIVTPQPCVAASPNEVCTPLLVGLQNGSCLAHREIVLRMSSWRLWRWVSCSGVHRDR